MSLWRPAAIWVACLPAACADPTPVLVRAEAAPGAPLADFQIVALPFSADALLDSLAVAAPVTRPRFPELESSLAAYRATPDAPAADATPGLTTTWLATRDSVARLADALGRMDRASPAYRDAYTGFRDLYGRYAAREAARDAAVRRRFAEDRALAARATRAADSLRRWERVAYRDFPRLAAERVAASGREVVRGTTDSAGVARFALRPGDWWLTARRPDPDNPFVEHHWEVPVRAAGVPFAVPISGLTGRTRWRH